jgi:hypothetical protein
LLCVVLRSHIGFPADLVKLSEGGGARGGSEGVGARGWERGGGERGGGSEGGGARGGARGGGADEMWEEGQVGGSVTFSM